MVRSLFIGLLVFTLIASGCANGESSPERLDSDPSAEDLRGRTFTSTAVTEDGEPRPLVAGTRIRLTFDEKRGLGWRAGCNHFGAKARITADTLLVGQVVGTEIGCPDDLQEQDEWVIDFFDSDPIWRLSDERLVLTSDGSVIELEGKGG